MIETIETNISIRNKLLFCIFLVVVTFVFSIAAFFYPGINPTTDPHGVWFQRSGSFMVIASIGTEFFLLRTEGYLDPYNEKYMSFTDMPDLLNNMHRHLSKAVIF